jgi:predicted DNA-binding protein (MmcQ/YjbR family)
MLLRQKIRRKDTYEDMEGKPRKGKIIELKVKQKINGIRKNKKGTITAYHVEGMGWISKVEAIRLTKAEKIDAVVATSRSGNIFLRTRPDVRIENNLEEMG